MAYDEMLAARFRDARHGRSGIGEKRMFGGETAKTAMGAPPHATKRAATSSETPGPVKSERAPTR